MDAIEKRAREIRDKFCQPGDYDYSDILDAIIAALTPPEEPDQALLVSMAMCLRHGFGLDTPEQQQSQLREMRKLWDEVMGRGYYSPESRERYIAMLAARPDHIAHDLKIVAARQDHSEHSLDMVNPMSVPDGFVLVPVEPTEKMSNAAFHAAGSPSNWMGLDEIWGATISACPEVPNVND